MRFISYFALLLFLVSCSKSKQLFERIPGEQSGIHFNNVITETDSINVLDFENVYNGGGVGIGDFNKDGLQDVYFTGNQVSNKLYLNKGNFRFDDVTDKARVEGKGRWARGVAVIDIDNNGWDDLYICASIKDKAEARQNLLYVNQGVNKDGIPQFKEMAAEYGLNDTTHSTMAAFFDYDNDGDLDCYIAVNEIIDGDLPNRFRPRMIKGEHPSTGKLYRNDWDPALKHGVFTDVSKAAGILVEGYSHSVTIADINKDGWKDIYVSNDYLSNNVLYINNGNGTFSDKVSTYFKHAAANAMGNDIIDINNDGLADLVELDMSPEDNFRKKMMRNPNSYQTYQNTEYFNYQYQYVRNMLQLNLGPRVSNDSIGDPIFGDISFLSGIAETDWSWTPLVTDFDNDGFRDIIITNGFPKDVTDHDFVAFRNEAYSIATKEQLLSQIPEVKIPNYAFRNNGDLTFANASKDWGLQDPSFSNGAAYADLDNDGDMDMVVNNINDEAFVYRNNSRESKQENGHYLQLQLLGDSLNRAGFGATVQVYYNHGKHQVWEHTPYRGYLSSIQNIVHFGLGGAASIDSVLIQWPNGRMQRLANVKADQVLKVSVADAEIPYNNPHEIFAKNSLFREVTNLLGINYLHQEKDFIDFNIQKLLPHKFSEYGPALAVGDVDGNGLDDIISGGSFSFSAQIFLQQSNGRFVQRSLIPGADINNKRWEDLGILLFDADGDGDLDLYTASGGYENERNTAVYQDKFYVNDGQGNFQPELAAIPQNLTSKSCVRAADYDKDGDLDLFIAGRVDPWHYPKAVSSFILRNDSRKGKAKFTDVTAKVAAELQNIGLVCDAVFTDVDNDGWQDLMLAGEWMPITILKNEKGSFKNITAHTGIDQKIGWWNSIAPGDFDNDGDIDYIVANQGLNSFYKGNQEYPVYITAKDFDNNGSYDAIPSLYLPDQGGDLEEFPAHTRDDLVKQMISMRAKFQNYRTFARATMDDVLTEEERKDALRLQANYFLSSYMRNDGGGRFSLVPLPQLAQISVLNGMSVDDVDGDGNLDVIINGNDYGTEVSVGRYDALNGLVLKGDGQGNFSPLSILESGIFIPGNGKALVELRGADGKCLLAASQNRGALKIFRLKKDMKCVPLRKDDVSALISYKNGKMRKQEIYYGASFLSQSGRFLSVNDNISNIQIINNKGKSRKLDL